MKLSGVLPSWRRFRRRFALRRRATRLETGGGELPGLPACLSAAGCAGVTCCAVCAACCHPRGGSRDWRALRCWPRGALGLPRAGVWVRAGARTCARDALRPRLLCGVLRAGVLLRAGVRPRAGVWRRAGARSHPRDGLRPRPWRCAGDGSRLRGALRVLKRTACWCFLSSWGISSPAAPAPPWRWRLETGGGELPGLPACLSAAGCAGVTCCAVCAACCHPEAARGGGSWAPSLRPGARDWRALRCWPRGALGLPRAGVWVRAG